MFENSGFQLSLLPETKHPIEILRENYSIPDSKTPIIVSYGGGRNSTLVLAMWDIIYRKIYDSLGIKAPIRKPDKILFADTGDESLQTYEYIEMFSDWLVKRGMPPITVVSRKPGKVSSDRKNLVRVNKAINFWLSLAKRPEISLEIWSEAYICLLWLKSVWGSKFYSLSQECIITGTLPSKAYGKSNCSQMWKIEPQQEFEKQWMIEQGLWEKKGRSIVPHVKIRKVIGFHSDEVHRLIDKKTGQMRSLQDRLYEYEYPLMLAMLNNQDCINGIAASGLPIPPKSSCIFCPRKKIAEIKSMNEEDLALSLFIEQMAMISPNWRHDSSINGLGQRLNWTELMMGEMPELEELAIARLQEQRQCACIDE